MTKRSVRLSCFAALAVCLLGGCTHGQLDLCGKGLDDPYGNTRR